MESKHHELYMQSILLIESEFKKRLIKILPKSEINYIPPLISEAKSLDVFIDYFFVFEKVINSRIIPMKYEIHYSSVFIANPKLNENAARIQQLEKLLKKSDDNINSKSLNYIPKSAYRFFSNSFGTDKNRYNPDYTSDMFGIRHLHLVNSSDDLLLFFCIRNNDIYFLDIGNHYSFFSDSNIRIIINEFPELLQHLGIHELVGISVGKIDSNSSDLEELWKAGGNSTFAINNKVYIGSLISSARTSSELVRILQSFSYSIENGINNIFRETSDETIVLNKIKSRISLKYGSMFFTNDINNKEYQIDVFYTKILQIIDQLIA